MQLTFKEKLPNLVSGIINKISMDVDYEIKEVGNDIEIFGKFIVIREIKNENRITEIKDCIPIEITIAKKYLIKKTKEVSLRLEGFHFEFEEDITVISGEIELSNVEETEDKYEEFEFIIEETINS
ncbi:MULTISPECIES: hypothetical protein [Bacillaceae]|mgnify:CR=1 FL=1|uniref:hypothetical protein n=1 Tax=Bacillaceae TaxID=186817 RepID=UPI000E2FD8C1|nr:hypothetical protein [Bacillus sp. HNG]RFB09942.1 hypothetical protein DZB84_23595 [Bacillus sp. HNG]